MNDAMTPGVPAPRATAHAGELSAESRGSGGTTTEPSPRAEAAGAAARRRAEPSARESTRDELRKVRRLEGLGRLAAGMCHEINNPLSFIVTSAELMEEELERTAPSFGPETHRELAELLRTISIGAERITQIVRNMKLFARQSDVPVKPLDLQQVVARAVELTRPHLYPHLELCVGEPTGARAMGRRFELEQVLVNLIENAAHAMANQTDQAARITISAALDDGRSASIRVSDTGPGIDPGVLDKVFDPFFTTKHVDRGLGLGLSICYNLVQRMAGTIEVTSDPEQGTTFTVRLPAAAAAPRLSAPTPAPPAPSSRTRPEERILIIDDEPFIVATLRRALRSYDLTCTGTARDALAQCEAQSFDIILCDIMMPGINGSDFHRMLAERSPGAERRIIFITGGTLLGHVREFLAGVPNLCVEKPFDSQQLRDLIDAQLEAHATADPD